MNNLKILLVEDSINDKLLLESYMSAIQGISILHHAENGEQALDYLSDVSNEQPNLILMDVQMPKMDGYECLKKIRSDSKYKKIPIIMLTNMIDDLYVSKSFNNCASGHIEKPQTPIQYKQVVENLYNYWSHTTKLPV